MPDAEEMPNTPGVLGDGILQDGVDSCAERRAAIREANARRQQDDAYKAVQRGQERAEKARWQAGPRKPAVPREG